IPKHCVGAVPGSMRSAWSAALDSPSGADGSGEEHEVKNPAVAKPRPNADNLVAARAFGDGVFTMNPQSLMGFAMIAMFDSLLFFWRGADRPPRRTLGGGALRHEAPHRGDKLSPSKADVYAGRRSSSGAISELVPRLCTEGRNDSGRRGIERGATCPNRSWDHAVMRGLSQRGCY